MAFQCQALVTGPIDKTVGRHDGLMGITISTDSDEILVFELGHDLLAAGRATENTSPK